MRLIHDLSWSPKLSVNELIDDKLCSLQHISVDDAVKHVKHCGTGALMSKLDLEDAFRHINVNPADWHLLGSSWRNIDGSVQYYVDMVLPFGLRSSPFLFDQYAAGLEYIMKCKGVTVAEHYLDDYFTCGSANSDQCNTNLSIMIEACNETGFNINFNKLVKPTTQLEFLGILIDSERMQLRITDARLYDIYSELLNWHQKTKCTKRQLVSIIGKLTFISRVVVAGRTFVRRMINLSKSVKYLHYTINLNTSFRDDIVWWLAFLPSWNGISAFRDDEWIADDHLELYTDSSDIAIGAVFRQYWLCIPFLTEGSLKAMSITWRELYAIVKAIATWGSEFRNKRILIHCDNAAVVYFVNSGTSRDPHIMKLVRSLFYLMAIFNLEIRVVHIAGLCNYLSDALSRLQIDTFFMLKPDACPFMTVPSTFYYDYDMIL